MATVPENSPISTEPLHSMPHDESDGLSWASIAIDPITVERWAEIEELRHYELVDGHLQEKPPVAFWHEFLLLNLFRYLDGYVRLRVLGCLVCATAPLRINKINGRRPDIFFIPKQLLHLVGKNVFKGVPPLVVEILSPRNAAEDRGRKRRDYAMLGVGEYWIVDLPNRAIEVYTLQAQIDGTREYELVETVRGDGIFRPAMFPGLEIPPAEIWPTEYENRSDD